MKTIRKLEMADRYACESLCAMIFTCECRENGGVYHTKRRLLATLLIHHRYRRFRAFHSVQDGRARLRHVCIVNENWKSVRNAIEIFNLFVWRIRALRSAFRLRRRSGPWAGPAAPEGDLYK